MKHTFKVVIAILALAPAAHAYEAVVIAHIPMVPTVIPTLQLPNRANTIPAQPSFPSKHIPGPFEHNLPKINFPTVPKIMPTLPMPIYVAPANVLKQQPKLQSPVTAMPKMLAAAANSEEGIKQNELDSAFDNSRVQDDGSTLVVIDDARRSQKKRASRHMLPESELELEIGIIQ